LGNKIDTARRNPPGLRTAGRDRRRKGNRSSVV
jgi:hypothetical protein